MSNEAGQIVTNLVGATGTIGMLARPDLDEKTVIVRAVFYKQQAHQQWLVLLVELADGTLYEIPPGWLILDVPANKG